MKLRKFLMLFVFAIALFLGLNKANAIQVGHYSDWRPYPGSSGTKPTNLTYYSSGNTITFVESAYYLFQGTSDSNLVPIFCLDPTVGIWTGEGYTNAGSDSGSACGIIKGLIDGDLTTADLDKVIDSKQADFGNSTYESAYKKVQNQIWRGTGYSCGLTVAKINYSAEASATLTVPSTGTMTLSGSYYVGEIDVTKSNISSYSISLTNAPTGTIVTDSASGTTNKTSSSATKLYVKIPVANVTGSINNLTVSLSGDYTKQTYDEVTPTVTKYTYSAHQTIGTLKYTKTQKTIPGTKSDSIVFSVNPKGSLTFTKKNAAGTKITQADGSYTLYKCASATDCTNRTKIEDFTTSSGVYTKSGLEFGKYQIVETTAPTGYILTTTVASATIDSTHLSVNTDLKNDAISFSLNKKIFGTSTNLAGAVFTITKPGGSTVTWNTTNDPTLTINYAVPGNYTIKETNAPSGYQKITATYTVKVNANGTIEAVTAPDDYFKVSGTTVTMYNKPYTYISKKSITGTNELSGADIKITSDDPTFKITFTSGTTPKELYLEPLASGKYYYLEETAAPTGYEKVTTKFKFTVDNTGKPTLVGTYSDKEISVSGKTITLLDKPYTYISKKGITGTDEVEGAKIKITSSSDPNFKEEFISGRTKKALYLEYKEGNYYYLQETVAPDGYEKLEQVFKFTVDKNGKPTLVEVGKFVSGRFVGTGEHNSDYFATSGNTITVRDEPTKTVLYKKDIKSGELLKGARIVIKDETKSTTVASFVSGDKDAWEKYLGPGIYYLIETVAPDGYEKSEEEYKIEIKENGDIVLLSGNPDHFSVSHNEITLYNSEIPIPNTGKSSSSFALYSVIGSLILFIGGFVIYFIIRKKKTA